jgi:hypothetical protein
MWVDELGRGITVVSEERCRMRVGGVKVDRGGEFLQEVDGERGVWLVG